MRIGDHIVIDRIFEEYGISQLLNKQFNAKEAGLFRDLVAYSIITEINVGQYYPDYAYNHRELSRCSSFARGWGIFYGQKPLYPINISCPGAQPGGLFCAYGLKN